MTAHAREYGDPVIIIPAWNEAANILRTISLIRETKIPVRIVVVDDGSRDGTARLVAQEKCAVIRFPRNRGKAAAFFAGIKRATRYSPLPSAIVTLDADLVRLPRKDLLSLITRAVSSTKKNKVEMIAASVRESRFNSPLLRFFTHSRGESTFRYTGTRSFSLPAAFALIQSNVKKRAKGYGLEVFQNSFFPRPYHAHLVTGIQVLPPFRRDPVRGARVEEGVAHAASQKHHIRKNSQRARRFSRR